MPNIYEKIHVHGDNIVECERILALIESSLAGEIKRVRGPLGSPVCPEFEFELKTRPKPLRLVLFPGFRRWDEDILEYIRNMGGSLREAADIILSSVGEKEELPILSIEFCGALPAGNQAWQRSGRAYSLGLARIPFLYIAEIGGYELDSDRKIKAPRLPNPAIPFSYLSYSVYQKVPVLPVFIASSGADKISKTRYKDIIGNFELLKFLRAIILGEDSTSYAQGLLEKALQFVQLRASVSRVDSTLNPELWEKAYSAIQSGKELPEFLLNNARLQWAKTAYIKGLTKTAKRLMNIASKYAIGLTSTDLPICLIPSEQRNVFARKVGQVYRNLPKQFLEWLGKNKILAVCWVMGFKPRGDDARPDRGLTPLARMLIGPGTELLTVVYGPAPANTWPLLISDPIGLMERNGLWESAMMATDALLVDSSTDKITNHGFLKTHWSSVVVERITKRFIVSPRPLRFGEQDVDTVLHLLLCRCGGSKIFEGMCNPPGGDWSGISMITVDRSVELRWLSLPRVGGKHAKRPDHVFEIFEIDKVPIMFVVESKEKAGDVEERIGPRLKAYLTDLLKSPASVERATVTGTEWTHTKRIISPTSINFCTGVAFLSESNTDIRDIKKKANADILLGFAFTPKGDFCNIKVHPCSQVGVKVADFIQTIQSMEARVTIELI
jgi:hypothetical protein